MQGYTRDPKVKHQLTLLSEENVYTLTHGQFLENAGVETLRVYAEAIMRDISSLVELSDSINTVLLEKDSVMLEKV